MMTTTHSVSQRRCVLSRQRPHLLRAIFIAQMSILCFPEQASANPLKRQIEESVKAQRSQGRLLTSGALSSETSTTPAMPATSTSPSSTPVASPTTTTKAEKSPEATPPTASPSSPANSGSPASTGEHPDTPAEPGTAPAPKTEPSPDVAPPSDASSGGPHGQNANAYALSFSEEFDSGLDTRLWNDSIWYDASNPTKNYAVENGVLKIWPQRDASARFFNRTLDTDGHYYQTYGYFEIEAKLPRGKGTWPGFWLFNHIGDRRPEIDIMEAYGGGQGWGHYDGSGVAIPTTYAPTAWPGNYETTPAGTKMYPTGADLSASFHKYAVKWEPNRQTYYFDGKEVLSVVIAMGDPMYIILDLWFGSAAGTPDDSTPQGKGNSFEINYVRAWKFR